MRHVRADTVPLRSGFASGASAEGAVPPLSYILGRLPDPLRQTVHSRRIPTLLISGQEGWRDLCCGVETDCDIPKTQWGSRL